MIETYRGVVYPHHIDHMGHMNVQYYTAMFDQATWHLFSTLGITLRYVNETHTGMAALEQRTKYKSELTAGALVVVQSGVIEVGNKTVRFFHRMLDPLTGAEAATTDMVAAHLDRKARKAIALPAFVAEKAAALMVEAPAP